MRIDLDALEGVPPKAVATDEVIGDSIGDERVLTNPRVAHEDQQTKEPEEDRETRVGPG
jgi:hypothetical protein